MSERPERSAKAYHNRPFLDGKEARALRILAEYLEPKGRFDRHHIEDTIVFMGSARIEAGASEAARTGAAAGNSGASQLDSDLSSYYHAARELARRLTEWSKTLDPGR